MIKEQLAGKKIAITGSTGFLGTALVEQLLRTIPNVKLVLLVRSSNRTASQRVKREILNNDAFDPLKKELGDEEFDRLAQEQIEAISADISLEDLGLDEKGKEALGGCDIVTHSAAAVSFDEPLDRAVEVNLMGPVRLVTLLKNLEYLQP